MNNSATLKALGVWRTFGLAQAWPELPGKLDRIYQARISGLKWIPRDWLDAVRELQASDPTYLVRIGPALSPAGARLPDAPTWCDTDDKLKAWQGIYELTNRAVNSYAQGKLAQGRIEMDAAYAAAEFWNAAYSIAVTIRDLPANVIGGALDGAQSVLGGVFGRLMKSWIFWAALAAAAGLAAWRFGLIRTRR